MLSIFSQKLTSTLVSRGVSCGGSYLSRGRVVYDAGLVKKYGSMASNEDDASIAPEEYIDRRKMKREFDLSNGSRASPVERVSRSRPTFERPLEEPVELPERTSSPRRKRAELGEVSFQELGLNSVLTGMLDGYRIKQPSAIQKLALPHLLRKFDARENRLYVPPTIAIQDYTGSGKTLAYALPIMQNTSTQIDKSVPPPEVIDTMNRLRGVHVAATPSAQVSQDMTSEYEKPKVIQYSENDVYRRDMKTSDQAEVESVDAWIHSMQLDVENMTEAEFKQVLLRRMHEMKEPPVNLSSLLQNDARFGRDMQKQRRLASLLQKMKEIFPTVNEEYLHPDAPQSRLQAIIVVPTKELAVQVRSTLMDINNSTFTQEKSSYRSDKVAGGRHEAARKSKPILRVSAVHGPVTPLLLKSLGIESVKAEEEVIKTEMKNPFVTFGKGHKEYRDDHAERREEVMEREKQYSARRMKSREKYIQLNRLHEIQNKDNFDNQNSSEMTNMDHMDEMEEHEMMMGVGKEHSSKTELNKASKMLYTQLQANPSDVIERDNTLQPHVLVGTPSTIAELIKSGAISLPSPVASKSQLKYMIFDEIDHLARNEESFEHTSVQELMSIPCDQMVFVSASMTRETALVMTRLARRQFLPTAYSTSTDRASWTGMLNIPCPPRLQVSDEQMDESMVEAEQYANDSWARVESTLQEEGLEPVLNKKGEAMPVDREARLATVKRKVMNKALTPYVPKNVELPVIADWNGLPVSTSSKEVGEVLFLTPDDYREGSEHELQQDSMPLPPFLRHYWVQVPEKTDKLGLLLDLVCQLKVSKQKNLQDQQQPAPVKKVVPKDSATSAIASSTTVKQTSDLTALLVPATTTPEQQPQQTESTNANKMLAVASSDICPGNILIFVGMEHHRRLKQLREMLENAGLRVGVYDSSVSRQERSEALMYNPDMDVLITNDSLARGIDLQVYSTVINLDLPRATSTYLHRAGRVGRLGSMFRRKSMVLNLIDEGNNRTKQSDKKVLNKHINQLKLNISTWPYKVPLNIHHTLISNITKKRMEAQKHGSAVNKILQHNRNGTMEGFHIKNNGIIIPTPQRKQADDQKRASKSSRQPSAADSKSWVTWDSNSKNWV